MAQTAVDIVVKTIGADKLRALDRQLKGIEPSAKKSARAIDGVSKAVQGLGRALATAALGDQLRRSFGAAAEFSATQQRVQNLTKTYQQFIGIQNVAAESAKRFGISNAQALSDLTDLGSRLGGTGASLKDLENIYQGFNTLLVNNAVGAQQAAAATLQLNQALGSGRLAGEEFNAINEATPQLLDEVAKVMGVARGELKQLASDGEISSQVLLKALQNIKTQGADALAGALDTPAGKLRQFDAAIKDFQVSVGTELLPVITPLVQGLTEMLRAFGQLPEPIRTAAVAVSVLAVAVGALNVALGALGVSGLGAAFAGIASAATGLATTLGVVGAKALALAQGKAVLAGAITAANTKITLMTVGLGALKVAMLALPWVAVGAAVAGLAKLTFDYYKKQADLNRLLNDSTVKSTELKDAVSAKAAELQKASSKLDKMKESGISNARAIAAQEKRVRELKAQLEALEGTYNVRVNLEIVASQIAADVEAQAEAAGGKAVGFDVLDQAGIREALARANGTYKEPGTGTNTRTGKGGGGGGGRESQLPQLQQELDLSNQLLENDRQRLQAQFDNNTALINKLAQDRIELELAGQKAAIALEDIPAAEKKLKVALAENDATLKTLELKSQIAEADRQRAEAIQGITQPLEDELELLQAKLNGNEDEIKQLQEIRKLKEQILELDPNADTSQVEAMVKQRDAMREQVAEMEKTKELVGQISGTIASEFSSAISSVIQGTKSIDEAFSDMLKSIGQSFIDMAMKIIEQQMVMIINGLIMKALGITSGGFGSGASAPSIGTSTNYFSGGFTPMNFFADGGRPPVGEVSVVGERGPELFVPDQPGRIVSNEQSRAALDRYNSGSESTVVNYSPSIQSTTISGQEYVTVEQMNQAVTTGMQMAAKKGAQGGFVRTMTSLKNNRSNRKTIGL